ncbi:hypothetical protein SPONL_1946 [uncultured Candidatus Thioglobus sp.]|nr:hypothetical protein SPONL_1946 [uncultured Candidatus Thioglobus sp.]
MAIRRINSAALNRVKFKSLSRVPMPMPNEPCGDLKGLDGSRASLESAAKAGKELAKLFS